MNIVSRLLTYTKQSLLLLSIACVGVLTSTTNVSAASFPSYTLTKDGTLSISGGGISNWKSSGSSIELEIDGAEFYAEDIATKSSYCTGGNNKASVRVAVAPDASAPTSVVQVYALCAAGGAIGEYSDAAWWTDGSRPIKNDSGISPGDPAPKPPGGVGGQETYSFNHAKNKSGEYILACSGMFRQFNEVGAPGTDLESCVELKSMGTSSGEGTDFTWHVKLTVPNSHKATYGCSGAAPFRYDFYIRTDTPPSIDADGMMAANIESKISDGKHCTQLELKDTLNSPKDILIMGGNELDDLLGEPIETGDDAQSLCQVEGGLGWILCPIMNTVAMINDGAFSLIQNFLEIPPMMTTGETSNAYNVWQAIRNMANVLFAFVFIIIVYSQLTSAGISNYGIKKMLPKMIIGVILVNTSFWIVALSVDLSNVVGSSIYEVMRGFGGDGESAIGGDGIPTWQTVTANLLALSAGVAVSIMVGLAVLLPMAVSALFMFMGLVFILTFRHAMVFILAIISPLAFVAYMLPNTEGLFKTWFKLFRVLLYIYPAVAFIMGASVIAATVMFSVSQTMDGIPRWTMMAIATAMPAMGIFAALMLAKTMGSVASKLGLKNPFSGVINATRDRVKTYGQRQDDRNASAALTGKGNFIRRGIGRVGGARRRAVYDAKNTAATRNKTLASQGYIAGGVGENAQRSLLNKATGGKFGSDNVIASRLSVGMGEAGRLRVIAEAKATESKELMGDIDNIMSTLDKEVASNPVELQIRFNKAVASENLAEMAAYQKLMIRNGSPGVTQSRQSLSDFTDTSGLSGDALKKRESQIMDMKDIMSGDETFKKAGRDFEVWSNNEHSIKTGQKDDNGNDIKIPHANFSAVSQDSSVWSSISAQRFASMNSSSQDLMLNQLETAAKSGSPEAYDSFVNRVLADKTAMGQIKEGPLKRIQERYAAISSPDASNKPSSPSSPSNPDTNPPAGGVTNNVTTNNSTTSSAINSAPNVSKPAPVSSDIKDSVGSLKIEHIEPAVTNPPVGGVINNVTNNTNTTNNTSTTNVSNAAPAQNRPSITFDEQNRPLPGAAGDNDDAAIRFQEGMEK